MIFITKINSEYYETHVDKNGGSFEVQKIVEVLQANCKETVKKISYYKVSCFQSKENTIVFIYGLLNEKEENNFKEMVKSLSFKNKVLLLTDLRISKDKDFANYGFNTILTQTPYNYSYIPDSFLTNNTKYTKSLMSNKIKVFVFGGNVDGRIVKLFDYYSAMQKVPMYIFGASKKDSFDYRLPYKIFKQLCKETKYSLILSDEVCTPYNFVTPRFVEALDDNTIPFVDSDYDPANLIVPKDYLLLVNNSEELEESLRKVEDEDFQLALFNQLNEIKENIWSRRNKLASLI